MIFSQLYRLNKTPFFKRLKRYLILIFRSKEFKELFKRIELIKKEVDNEDEGERAE